MFYHDRKQELHNSWIVHGADTTPETIEHTLQMCDKYQKKGKEYCTRVTSKEGVVCVQQGKEVAGGKKANQIMTKRGGGDEIYFNQDGSKQSMREIVMTDKKLYL